MSPRKPNYSTPIEVCELSIVFSLTLKNMAVDLDLINTSLASVQAGSQTIKLLKELHIQALSEPPFVTGDPSSYSVALDKFVALDPDKCALVYLLLRASGARFVVEAGTSFGVSTIYLALAVSQNAATAKTVAGKVIATENEPTKAQKARQHWKSAGDDVENWIELREGDLRETLKTNMPDKIDFLLLDSKHMSDSNQLMRFSPLMELHSLVATRPPK